MAAAFAAWCATVLSAISCAGQLALSGTASWSVVFPAMAGVHMLIGIGEACVTALVIVAVANLRPDLVDEAIHPPLSQRYGEVILFGLLISLGLVLFVAPFACPWPDGLEKIAATLGFEHKAAQPLIAAPVTRSQLLRWFLRLGDCWRGAGIASHSLSHCAPPRTGSKIKY